MILSNWRCDGEPVAIPHAWGAETDLRFEGPRVYETTFQASGTGWLLFHGVSAHARVFVNGSLVCEHLGIWDAFSVRVLHGGEISLRVEVVKNGGETIPVASIASGFLPYVFSTFGGIYRPVEWVEGDAAPLVTTGAPPARAVFDGHKLLVDGEPTYLRGILHWGWYPELRHPHPDRETCRREIAAIAEMGFNCVKFCLWTPPHHYLEELESARMLAWMELPIWNPGSNTQQFNIELDRIVAQYRHHRAIVLWTVGCETGHQMSREGRAELFDRVKSAVGGAPVKDSSGGAEMYGGDPVEFGDFEDFHPYCDLANYPQVLDSLTAGPRKSRAILLGECNDFDSHRDLPRIAAESPYWASEDPALNAQGVRWQYDLPRVVASSRFVSDQELHERLMRNSLEMKLFARRTFQEWLRSRNFAGSVITGLADTPISSSGFFDDWGAQKFDSGEVRRFMGSDVFFLIPQRKLPWIDGGNQVGLFDAWHVFEGWNRLRVGMHSESGFEGRIEWEIGDSRGDTIAHVAPLEPSEVADIVWQASPDRCYTLTVRCAASEQTWPIESVERAMATEADLIPQCVLGDVRAPAFREAAYLFLHPALERLFAGKPHTLYAALTGSFLAQDTYEYYGDPLMLRVDTRTYREVPVAGIADGFVLHTLRTGNDPAGLLVQRALASIAAEYDGA